MGIHVAITGGNHKLLCQGINDSTSQILNDAIDRRFIFIWENFHAWRNFIKREIWKANILLVEWVLCGRVAYSNSNIAWNTIYKWKLEPKDVDIKT